MKTLLLPFIFLIFSSFTEKPPTELEPGMLDFWVGNWQLTWQMQDGKIGKGTNEIVKILDGSVVQENFQAVDAGKQTGFKGTSISVFNPRSKSWHQAWADNQGGYFDFIGSKVDNKVMFSTKPNKQIVQRMVFYNITENEFDWDWESSKDDGKTWKLSWRIHYKRAE